MSEPLPKRMSHAAYLEAEQRSDIRHEYLRGEVYAMAGGTPEHSALAMAVGAALTTALAGRRCRVFGSDLRVRIESTDLTTYPDLTVICGSFESSADDPNAATNPILIVEVLSDSTEAYDRGEKFAHYRRLPSLREYVLVSQREPRIEAYRKNAAGEWVLGEAGPGEVLPLASLEGVRLETDVIYRDPLAS
ncbi:Uma2 family endonuclease [Nannocystaceae bacterium ST9]